MRSILDSHIGIIIFALDLEYRYLTFTKTHAQIMKNIWGVDIKIGTSMLDYLTNNSDKESAKVNFDRALSGEYFVLREEYGDVQINRKIWEDRYAPIYDLKQNIIGLSVLITDLTSTIDTEKITRIAQLQQEISIERELLLNSLGEGVYGVNNDGCCFFINPAALNIFGFKTEEIIGKNTHGLVHHHRADGSAYLEKDCIIHRAKKMKEKLVQRDWLFRKNGDIFPAELIATPMLKNENAIGVVIAFRDITEQVAAEEKLKIINDELLVQSITDPLTKIYNRRFFMEQGNLIFSQAKQNIIALSIIAFDIDFFKKINDTYGHDIGDKVLIHISAIAKNNLREKDIIARVGGEEFTIILNHTEKDRAIKIAKRIHDEIQTTPISVSSADIICTISMGISWINQDSLNFNELLKQADEALYLAKNSGRNCYKLCNK
jgi:diguanylate cyclase (GGDEF)-like protein/PAS domain S-box-containing protein